MTRPNILLIQTDNHTAAMNGFMGDRIVQTRNLDALAARSVQFNLAVCATPICTPSRMCLITGRQPHNCAGWSNHWVLFPEHRTWPQHFADHGYTTCQVGKMHFGGADQMHGFQFRPYGDLKHGLGHQPEPLSSFPGYDHVQSAGVTEIPESLIQDNVITREALAFALEHEDAQPEKPWFMYVSYTRPHPPLRSPGRYLRHYRDKVPYTVYDASHYATLSSFDQWLTDQNGYARLTADEIKAGREAYYANIDFVDDCIGELIRGLEHAGAIDNTIVIFLSDHGEMAGAHGIWHTGKFYDESILTALLMSGPGIRAGHHEVNAPISHLDIFPTCCRLCDLPVPDGVEGFDVSPVLAHPGHSPMPREYAACEYMYWGVRVKAHAIALNTPCRAWRTVVNEQWKYVHIQGGESLLFNRADDPTEDNNVVDRPDYADVRDELHRKLCTDFSWEQVVAQYQEDLVRIDEYASGVKPTTPNQYTLQDGRTFDAESELYGARWLAVPNVTGGIIPQQYG